MASRPSNDWRVAIPGDAEGHTHWIFRTTEHSSGQRFQGCSLQCSKPRAGEAVSAVMLSDDDFEDVDYIMKGMEGGKTLVQKYTRGFDIDAMTSGEHRGRACPLFT